jgi:hypothetical protein
MPTGIVLAVAAAALAGVVLLVAWVVRLKRRTAAAMRGRFGARVVLIDEAANCLGVESRGVAQVRGNGCLVATDDAICFAMWAPRREMTIRRSDIVTVETPRSHLGKSKGIPLLKIVYAEGSSRDSVAWAVRDLDTWVNLLTQRRRDR